MLSIVFVFAVMDSLFVRQEPGDGEYLMRTNGVSYRVYKIRDGQAIRDHTKSHWVDDEDVRWNEQTLWSQLDNDSLEYREMDRLTRESDFTGYYTSPTVSDCSGDEESQEPWTLDEAYEMQVGVDDEDSAAYVDSIYCISMLLIIVYIESVMQVQVVQRHLSRGYNEIMAYIVLIRCKMSLP